MICVVGKIVLFMMVCFVRHGYSKKFQTQNIVRVTQDARLNDTIVLGAPCSFNIDDRFFAHGPQLKNAWSLYINWVNNKGGINFQGKNVSITLLCIEDHSDVEYAANAVNNMLSDDVAVDLFLGPYSSSLTKHVSDILDPLGKFLMAPAAAKVEVYSGKSYTFSTTAPSFVYVEAVFKSLCNFKAKRVAIIRDNNEPICHLDEVLAINSSHAVDLYGYYDVDPNDPDYEMNIRAILIDLKVNGVESVLGCSYVDLCILIPSIAKSIDYNPQGMMFTICHLVPKVHEVLGNDADYILGVTPWVPTVNTVDEFVGWTAVEFQRRFKATFNNEPSYRAASAFAAIEILIAVVEEIQSIDPNLIGQALMSSIFRTLYGEVSFDGNHQAMLDFLVLQLRLLNDTEVAVDIIVDPPDKATASVVWPVPTWKQQECVRATQSCSSHGECDTSGTCICDAQYYTSSIPCDTYCDGEINEETGHCHADVVMYVGGIVDDMLGDTAEIMSTMQLAVDLINDHSDGWFDSTRQVKIVLKIVESHCSVEGGQRAMRDLMDWASTAGTTLFGVIGSTCSDSSKGAAKIGNNYYIPQISYASTSNELSDKDEYRYFARTIGADSSQGRLLVDMLEDVGLVPFLAVISTSDSYAKSLSSEIKDSYTGHGHKLLYEHEYTPTQSDGNERYELILNELAATGSPVTVLVMHEDELSKFMAAASEHPIYQEDGMVWVGIEAWTGVDGPWNRKGMIGLRPYTPSSNVTSAYLDLWSSLDPLKYQDSDGDRSSVSNYALYVADAVFALALAFQESTALETGSEGDVLKRHISTIITDDISFQGEIYVFLLVLTFIFVFFAGVTGFIDFLSNGNRNGDMFSISAFDRSWSDIGSVNEQGELVTNFSRIVWPDSSSGKATTYSKQFPLLCPPGQEASKQSSDGHEVFKCTYCDVGFYSPDLGPQACLKCPEGTDCNDVGVAIPCISPGYWRAEPPKSEELGNFETYPVFECDIDEACIGGCSLGSTCAQGRKGSSVTCGVCTDGYFLDYLGKCMKCDENEASYTQAKRTLLGLYCGVCIAICSLYYVCLRISAHKSIKDLSTESNAPSYGMKILQKTKDILVKAKLYFRQNLSSTCKIILAFFQVMGAFFPLDIHDERSSSRSFQEFFRSYNVNPFHGHEGIVECSSVTDTPTYYFLLLNCFFSPLAVVTLLGMISLVVYFYHGNRFLRKLANEQSKKEREMKINSLALEIKATFVRIVLWLCLVFYPAVCSVILSVLNCRNFGVSGVWLRVDNSISCDDESYPKYLFLAITGILLYVVGIPLLFWYIIKNRDKTVNNVSEHALGMWQGTSDVLHHGYHRGCEYYEIFHLLRKLLITSLSQFVASPSSSSQVIFMLTCDLFALIVLVKYAPYEHLNDNLLSTVLTTMEVVSFWLALLIVSGISGDEGYDEDLMYYIWAALLFASLLNIVFTVAAKIMKWENQYKQLFDSFMDKFDNCRGHMSRILSKFSPQKAQQVDLQYDNL